MLSIIVYHSSITFDLVGGGHQHLMYLLATPFKFATIGFFVISGFLLGERVDRRDPLEYFMRRVRRVFVPWLFWAGLMCTLLIGDKLALAGLGHFTPREAMSVVRSTTSHVMFVTSYWFVPNLLLSIATLLAFRRYLYSLKLGFILLAANLVYSVNLYTVWFHSGHTRALFGFVFYLWLGSYAAQNFEKISRFLNRIPTAALVAASVITGAAAFAEAHLLSSLGRVDPMNTLRLSNQVFSICMVLLIFKFKRATWPGFMDVRRDTFGLYLTSPVALMFLTHLVWLCHRRTLGSIYARDAEATLLWIVLAAVTYASCLMVTSWLANRPSLQWMVGLGAEAPTSRSDLSALDARGLVVSP